MKRRNRVGGRRSSSRSKPLGIFTGRQQRKRKSRTFEQLEDRFCFSVAPLEVHTVSLSNDTAEGAAELWMRELEWALRAGSEGSDIGYTTLGLPSDPLFEKQWHLLNTGQAVGNPDYQAIFGVAGEDINIAEAWNLGYTGAGIIIAVNDTGTQLAHPDLIANLHPTLRFNAITGTNNPNPNLFEFAAFHGTSVAGLIAATANNGEGGSGVAPGAQLAPVRLLGFGTTNFSIASAFNFATQNNIPITNNSWGHAAERAAIPMSPIELAALRDSIVFGRNGLGIIHVFASGNAGGPAFAEGFQSIGNWDSSNYESYTNSRYVIAVTGVDHDGLYSNVDGTFTAYPEAGSNVLVAAPTGSNAFLSIADDTGLGSGIWTTDLIGDFGLNAAPLPNGFDPDRDFEPNPDYTSRFNGTSAAAPLVSGVIALMLEANPNLSYRDVQEILVRSARQNAQFEVPASGGIPGGGLTLLADRPLVTTWQTNQVGPFRDPDPWSFLAPPFAFEAIWDPIADPNIEPFLFFGTNDFPLRSATSHYEAQPGLLTNGAGYTVSQGYGVYSEMTGYGHGVIDAGLAVKMAEQWHTLSQNASPERTFSTFVVQPGPQTGWRFPAAEKMAPENGAMIVPGGIAGDDGFIDYWNEYFADEPFSGDDPPVNSRGFSYWQFAVPDDKSINLEWVEVKVSLAGPPEDVDFIRINLTSPEGTVSELNHFYADPEVVAGPFSFQPISIPPGRHDPPGDINVSGGNFVWTFSTNRNWGESTRTQVIIDPLTGEPLMQEDFAGQPVAPFERSWELHLENWSSSEFTIAAVEIVWHGKPIEVDAQRVQGFVGVDTNNDEQFNYTRYDTVLYDSDLNPGVLRTSELVNELDLTQEPFADSVLVEAFRVNIVNGERVPENDPVDRFLTGADGNYYFDLVPGDYMIRATDPKEREMLEDSDTDPQFLQHFKQEWHITPDWFFAPARELPTVGAELTLDQDEQFFYFAKNEYALGEILYDSTTDAPAKFEYVVQELGAPVAKNVPMGVKNLNFLLKQDAPPDEIVVHGTVIADVNANGRFDNNDSPAGGIFVYHDLNRNNVHDAGEQMVVSSEDPNTRGQYTLVIPATIAGTYAVGVIPPAPAGTWIPTNPDDGVQDIFAGPGDVVSSINFFLDPPDNAFPPEGSNEPGNILGVVFNDLDMDRIRDPGEVGLPGFRVFIDANENGTFDPGEAFSITSSNGSFFFSDVAPGFHQLDIQIANEGTDDASWRLTVPVVGYRDIALGPGGVATAVFGLENRANRDWGDLPNTYSTLASSNGPNHVLVPGFRLGGAVDGEVNGIPSVGADGDDLIGNDDDGVRILSNGGALQVGPNLLEVTVSGVGGILNGWLDINGNGQFDVGEQAITDLHLNPGVRHVTVTLPPDAASGAMAARFRWGEAGLSFTGPAGIGEVEDYFLPNSVVPAIVLAGDYNLDGMVDGADRQVWASTFGSTSDLRADGNRDGVVDAADFILWRKNEGATAAASTASGSSVADSTSDDLPVARSLSTRGPDGYVGRPTYRPAGPSIGIENRPTTDNGLAGQAARLPASDSSDGGSSLSALLAGLSTSDMVSASSFVATGQPLAAASVDEGRATAGLLLLDEAWAELDRDADRQTDDGESLDWTGDNDDSLSDLALAAVFEEDGDWWDAI